MYHTYESWSLIWFVLYMILMRLENEKYSRGVNIPGGESSAGVKKKIYKGVNHKRGETSWIHIYIWYMLTGGKKIIQV